MQSRRSRTLLVLILAIVVVLPSACVAQWRTFNPVTSVETKADRVVMRLKSGVLTIQVCTESILRITSAPAEGVPERPEFVVQRNSWPAPQFKVQDGTDDVTITTARLQVVVHKAN